MTNINQQLKDPFVIKLIDFDGYRVRLQQSRRSNQMQIKFGDGAPEDQPPEKILQLITTPDGPHGRKLFHWNSKDRAWSTRIVTAMRSETRWRVEQIFDEVVRSVAEGKGIGPAR